MKRTSRFKSLGRMARRKRSVLASLLIFGGGQAVFGAGVFWNGGSGEWHVNENWEAVPEVNGSGEIFFHDGPPRPQDHAFIRTDGASSVRLNGDADVKEVTLANGNRLRTEGHVLRTGRLNAADAALLVNQPTASGGHGAMIGQLDLSPGGGLTMMHQNASIGISEQLTVADTAFLSGKGRVDFTSPGAKLNNNGTISVDAFGAFGGGTGTLTIASPSAALDLDGSTETGILRARRSVSDRLNQLNLVVDAELADAFSGTIEIGANDVVDFRRNLDVAFGHLSMNGADIGATIRSPAHSFVSSTVAVNGIGVVEGGFLARDTVIKIEENSTLHLTGDSNIDVESSFDWNRPNTGLKISGNTRVVTPSTGWLRSGLDTLDIDSGSLVLENRWTGEERIDFEGNLSVSNGSFAMDSLPDDASWSTANPVHMTNGTIGGGAFEVSSSLVGNGAVESASLGNVGTIEAVGGTLEVNSRLGASLDGPYFPPGYFAETPDAFNTPDGQGTVLAEQGSVVVSGRLDRSHFHGEISVANGNSFLSPENVMSFRPGEFQSETGRLKLDHGHFESGDLSLGGKLEVKNNASTITSPRARFMPGGENLIDADLVLQADSEVREGAVFSGEGTLVNAPNRTMQTMTEEMDIALLNEGNLAIEDVYGFSAPPQHEPVGRLEVEGFEQTGTGTLVVDLADLERADLLVVNGHATLGGTLEFAVADDFVASGYRTIPLIGADSLGGTFARVEGVPTDDRFSLAVTYSDTGAFLTAAVPGDANLDAEVNFADFLVMSERFGQPGGWSDGDFDGDGTIAFGDFLALSAQFGTQPGNVAAVPEPTSIALLGSTVLLLAGRRRRSN